MTSLSHVHVSLEQMLRSRVELCHVWLCGTLLLRGKHAAHILCKDLTELDTPLVEAVDAIEEALNSHSVFVKSQKLTAIVRVETTAEEHTKRRAITLE